MIRPRSTSTLTLATSSRKKPPPLNARTKRKPVRALVDVQARAAGCLGAYLAMVDGDGAIEKKDRTMEIVRWMSEEARIPCALNLRYTEESQSVALLRRTER